MAISSSRRDFLITSACAAPAMALGLGATRVLAQDQAWPTKAIRIIVPFPAGSITDTIARLLSEPLSRALKQPVVVENKGGANGSIGATEVARAAPDGYTLLVTNSSSITVNPLIYKNSQYKATDFVPITLVLDAPFVLTVNPEWAKQNSINSAADLVAFAKKNPGEVTYGSAGQGNLAHLAYAQWGNEAQFKARHIPYKSGAQASTAVMAGEVNSTFDTLGSAPNIAAGKLKALAVTPKERIAQLPDVPTMTEAGFPNIDFMFWLGLLAPKGTPARIVETLYEQSKAAMGEPAASKALSAQGTIVMLNPKDFSARISRESAQQAGVIKRENIVIE